MKAIARFHSAKAEGYFSTMIRHFAQKIPVTEKDGFARLEFSCGTADVQLSHQGMTIGVSATTPAELAQTCDVVERHLLRFAFREDPRPLDWQRPES